MTGSEQAAQLYDAVGAIYLQLFGAHVHVGFYQDLASRRTRSWQQAQHDHIDAVLDAAGVKKATKLLDLGCGYGGTAVHVAQRLGCQAVGVNISPFQVSAANDLARREGFAPADVSFVVGDALEPGLEDGSFDLVMSVESAAYMPDKPKFIEQMSRLVAPGGTVVLVDFCRAEGPPSPELTRRLAHMDDIFATPGSWHSAAEYRKLLALNGLTIVREENWTNNICGFWNQGLLSLLFRNSRPGQSVGHWLLEVLLRMLTCLWLTLIGGLAVLNLTFKFLGGVQRRAVQGGLDNGGLQYKLLVARKPLPLVVTAFCSASSSSDGGGSPASDEKRLSDGSGTGVASQRF